MAGCACTLKVTQVEEQLTVTLVRLPMVDHGGSGGDTLLQASLTQGLPMQLFGACIAPLDCRVELPILLRLFSALRAAGLAHHCVTHLSC